VTMDIKGKTAVIVGATGGMGSEVSKALRAEGVNLVLVAKTEEKLKSLSQELGESAYCTCDLSKPETISTLCARIVQKYPTIDFLLNAAGIGVYKSIEEVTEGDWNDSFNANVTASYFFTKYLLPSLKSSQKSAVLYWGSGMGLIPTGGRSVYCMTKFALRGMSLSLAKEFERTNVHIVHLTLGSVLTEFGPMTLEEKKKENLEGKAYLTPDWVAKKVVEILKNEDFKEEIELYPSDYVEGIR
jgi:short-subunit dehydrogenase